MGDYNNTFIDERWKQGPIWVLLLKWSQQERIYASELAINRSLDGNHSSESRKKELLAEWSNVHKRQVWGIMLTQSQSHSEIGYQAPGTYPDRVNARATDLRLKIITKLKNWNPCRQSWLGDKVPSVNVALQTITTGNIAEILKVLRHKVNMNATYKEQCAWRIRM